MTLATGGHPTPITDWLGRAAVVLAAGAAWGVVLGLVARRLAGRILGNT